MRRHLSVTIQWWLPHLIPKKWSTLETVNLSHSMRVEALMQLWASVSTSTVHKHPESTLPHTLSPQTHSFISLSSINMTSDKIIYSTSLERWQFLKLFHVATSQNTYGSCSRGQSQKVSKSMLWGSSVCMRVKGIPFPAVLCFSLDLIGEPLLCSWNAVPASSGGEHSLTSLLHWLLTSFSRIMRYI